MRHARVDKNAIKLLAVDALGRFPAVRKRQDFVSEGLDYCFRGFQDVRIVVHHKDFQRHIRLPRPL